MPKKTNRRAPAGWNAPAWGAKFFPVLRRETNKPPEFGQSAGAMQAARFPRHRK